MVAYSFQPMFVPPVLAGLGLKLDDLDKFVQASDAVAKQPPSSLEPKTHTIRADRGGRGHARPGELLQLYCGMRTKQCFKIGDARCTDVQRITLLFDMPAIMIGDRAIRKAYGLERFARMDGFANFFQMRDFWDRHHPGVRTFNGWIIYWEPIPQPQQENAEQ